MICSNPPRRSHMLEASGLEQTPMTTKNNTEQGLGNFPWVNRFRFPGADVESLASNWSENPTPTTPMTSFFIVKAVAEVDFQ